MLHKMLTDRTIKSRRGPTVNELHVSIGQFVKPLSPLALFSQPVKPATPGEFN